MITEHFDIGVDIDGVVRTPDLVPIRDLLVSIIINVLKFAGEFLVASGLVVTPSERGIYVLF